MANLPEEPVWHEGIRQLETGDPCVGGVPVLTEGAEAGHDNIAAKQLADRTAWLKNFGEQNRGLMQNKTALVLTAGTVSPIKANLGAGLHEFGLTIRFPVTKIPTANPTVLRGLGGASADPDMVEPASSLRVELKTDGKLQVSVFDETTASRVIESDVSLVSTHAGKWVDPVLVRDSSGVRIYLNGGLYMTDDHEDWLTPINLDWVHFGFCSLNSWVGEMLGGPAVLNYAVPLTTVGSTKGIADRYADGIFMMAADLVRQRVIYETDFSSQSGWSFNNGSIAITGGELTYDDISDNARATRIYSSGLWQEGDRARITFECDTAGLIVNFEGTGASIYTSAYTPGNPFSTVLGQNVFELTLMVPSPNSTYGIRFGAGSPSAGAIDDFKIESMGALCYFPEIAGVGRQLQNVTPNQIPATLASSGLNYHPPSLRGEIIALNQDVTGGAYIYTDTGKMLPRNAVVTEIVVMGGGDTGGLYVAGLADRQQSLDYRNIRFASDGASGVRIYRADDAGTSYEQLCDDIPVSEINDDNFSVAIHYEVYPDTVNGGSLIW